MRGDFDWDDDEDTWPDIEQCCIDCGRESVDGCGCCGAPLCHVCAECGGGFATGHPLEEHIPDLERRMQG